MASEASICGHLEAGARKRFPGKLCLVFGEDFELFGEKCTTNGVLAHR